MGDGRTYENVCAVRCVQTTDYMTADWYVLGASPSATLATTCHLLPTTLTMLTARTRITPSPTCPRRSFDTPLAVRHLTSPHLTSPSTLCRYHMPYEVLGTISNRIINEVRGINRVCYDISSKPPATIEWE